jgi:hypothetical protein
MTRDSDGSNVTVAAKLLAENASVLPKYPSLGFPNNPTRAYAVCWIVMLMIFRELLRHRRFCQSNITAHLFFEDNNTNENRGTLTRISLFIKP